MFHWFVGERQPPTSTLHLGIPRGRSRCSRPGQVKKTGVKRCSLQAISKPDFGYPRRAAGAGASRSPSRSAARRARANSRAAHSAVPALTRARVAAAGIRPLIRQSRSLANRRCWQHRAAAHRSRKSLSGPTCLQLLVSHSPGFARSGGRRLPGPMPSIDPSHSIRCRFRSGSTGCPDLR